MRSLDASVSGADGINIGKGKSERSVACEESAAVHVADFGERSF